MNLSVVARRCQIGAQEYVSVMRRLPLEDQLKIYSLSKVKIEGREKILATGEKVAAILGFAPGSVSFEFHGKFRGGKGYATPVLQEIHFGDHTSLHAIVHELTHLLCDKETTVYHYTEGRRPKASWHNQGFTIWLQMAVDNVLEHGEEWGVRLFTAEELFSLTVL